MSNFFTQMGCVATFHPSWQTFSTTASIKSLSLTVSSNPYLLVNGVSQVSVLSVFLFHHLITSNVHYSLTQILFTDDLGIHLQINNTLRAQGLIQNTIQQVVTWANIHGFSISNKKPELIIFIRRYSPLHLPLKPW